MNEEKLKDNLNKLHVERSFGKQIAKMHYVGHFIVLMITKK
jgi:hypothetical protein